MRMWVWSLASLSGLKIWCCCGYGVGQQLQLWLDPLPGNLPRTWVCPPPKTTLQKKPHPQTNQLTKERDSDHTMGEEIHDEANVFERMVLEQRPEGGKSWLWEHLYWRQKEHKLKSLRWGLNDALKKTERKPELLKCGYQAWDNMQARSSVQRRWESILII